MSGLREAGRSRPQRIGEAPARPKSKRPGYAPAHKNDNTSTTRLSRRYGQTGLPARESRLVNRSTSAAITARAPTTQPAKSSQAEKSAHIISAVSPVADVGEQRADETSIGDRHRRLMKRGLGQHQHCLRTDHRLSTAASWMHPPNQHEVERFPGGSAFKNS